MRSPAISLPSFVERACLLVLLLDAVPSLPSTRTVARRWPVQSKKSRSERPERESEEKEGENQRQQNSQPFLFSLTIALLFPLLSPFPPSSMLSPLYNPYAQPIDFQQLSQDVPAFAPLFVRSHSTSSPHLGSDPHPPRSLKESGGGRANIDWKDDAAVRCALAVLSELE